MDRIRTITDITLLDLLQDLWPNVCMAFLVCGDRGRLEVHNLGDATGHFSCSFNSLNG